jgi:hypothetical protein
MSYGVVPGPLRDKLRQHSRKVLNRSLLLLIGTFLLVSLAANTRKSCLSLTTNDIRMLSFKLGGKGPPSTGNSTGALRAAGRDHAAVGGSSSLPAYDASCCSSPCNTASLSK